MAIHITRLPDAVSKLCLPHSIAETLVLGNVVCTLVLCPFITLLISSTLHPISLRGDALELHTHAKRRICAIPHSKSQRRARTATVPRLSGSQGNHAMKALRLDPLISCRYIAADVVDRASKPSISLSGSTLPIWPPVMVSAPRILLIDI